MNLRCPHCKKDFKVKDGRAKGGVARWAGVSAEARRAIMQAAAKARWSKRKASA